MQVLLQKHYESEAVYHKELFLLLTQLAFLFLLLLAHDLCALIDLLDAFFDIEELFQFKVVLGHKRIRLMLLLTQLPTLHLHEL